MFYDVNGFALPACSVYANQPSEMYDVDGEAYITEKPTDGMVLDWNEPFETIDRDIWIFREGAYRTNVYCVGYDEECSYTNEDGLVLKAIKNNPVSGYEWSSPYMRTYINNDYGGNEYRATYEMLYGAIESKIKFSDAGKFHCSLWMLRSRENNIYYNGEIDIAECANGLVHFGIHVYGPQTEDGEGNNTTKRRSYLIGYFPVNGREYNTYTFVWTHEYIAAYCNNIYLGRFPIDRAYVDGNNSLQHPYYIILNAIPVSTTEVDETENNIEYLKCYKLPEE